MSTIEIKTVKTTNRSMITASTDIYHFIIQLGTLMAAEKCSETNWRRRRVAIMTTIITNTGFDPTNERNRIPFLQVNSVRSSAREATMDETRRRQWRQLSWVQDSTLSTREIEYHSYKSFERDHRSENLQSMARSYPWIGNSGDRRWETIASQHSFHYIPSNSVKCIDYNWRVHLQLQQPRGSSEDSNTKGNSNNSNNPAETQLHEETCHPDDEDEDEDEDESTLPETEDTRGQDDILSKITKDDQKEMPQQNRMLLKLLFEQQAEWKKDEPECFRNSTAAEPPTDRRIPEISPKCIRWLTPHGTAAGRKSWISSSKHQDQTLLLLSIYSQEAIPIKSMKAGKSGPIRVG